MFRHGLRKRHDARRGGEDDQEPEDPKRRGGSTLPHDERTETGGRETGDGEPRKRIGGRGDAMHRVHDRLAERQREQPDVPPDHNRLRHQVQQRRRGPSCACAQRQDPIRGSDQNQREARHEDAPQPSLPPIVLTGMQHPVVREDNDRQNEGDFLRCNREQTERDAQHAKRTTLPQDCRARDDQRSQEPHRAQHL